MRYIRRSAVVVAIVLISILLAVGLIYKSWFGPYPGDQADARYKNVEFHGAYYSRGRIEYTYFEIRWTDSPQVNGLSINIKYNEKVAYLGDLKSMGDLPGWHREEREGAIEIKSPHGSVGRYTKKYCYFIMNPQDVVKIVVDGKEIGFPVDKAAVDSIFGNPDALDFEKRLR